MKKLLVLAVLGIGGGWWYFVAGRTLTEAQVRTFYAEMERATLERKPDELCKVMSEDFEGIVTTRVQGEDQTQTLNKDQTCESFVETYKLFDKIGEKMGGLVQLDSSSEIHSIDLSDDKKRAIVDISTKLVVGGSIMTARSRSVDTLIRRNGKVMIQRSDARQSISAA
jgi:hypothetical protein